jgi:hypothetical protein
LEFHESPPPTPLSLFCGPRIAEEIVKQVTRNMKEITVHISDLIFRYQMTSLSRSVTYNFTAKFKETIGLWDGCYELLMMVWQVASVLGR